MPTTKSALLRYLLIDIRLRKDPNPSLEDLKLFVETEFSDITDEKTKFSKLTLKKDLKDMRKIFFAPIGFSFHDNNYRYEVKNYTFLKLPENIIERLIYNIKLQYLLGNKFNNPMPIIFETATSTKGYEYLPILSKAMGLRKVVSINYKSINSKRNRTYLIHPHLLKENRNTFYLLGVKDKDNEIRTFALDRIVEPPVILDIDAELLKDFDAEKYFNDSIGITAQAKTAITIELSFTPEQGAYILEKPLHKSQQIIIENENELRISISVEPTYEVIANILSYGDAVEVISPDTFKELIADRLKSAYNRYLA
jgi:WYL domain-containing protein